MPTHQHPPATGGAEPGGWLTRLGRWLAPAPATGTPSLPPRPEAWVSGHVVLVMEDRFRLVDPDGRGYLFTLHHRSGMAAAELEQWEAHRQAVRVGYSGLPDQGAVAHRVEAIEAPLQAPRD